MTATINWSCWTTGDDTTGDGSAENPYKTIDKASTGLSGGDEVRVSKSPAHTALAGTLTWTINSTSVSTSEDLTGVLAANDMIGKNGSGADGLWYEISSINTTTITLSHRFCGTNGAATSYKMGFHDLGSPATYSTVDSVASAGTSALSRLEISGGWDLDTELRDGRSFFCITSSGPGGYLLAGTSKNHTRLKDLIYCRGYNALSLSGTGVIYEDCEVYATTAASGHGSLTDAQFIKFKSIKTSHVVSFGSAPIVDDVIVSSSSGFSDALTMGTTNKAHIKKITGICCQYSLLRLGNAGARIDEVIASHCASVFTLSNSGKGNGAHKITKLSANDCTAIIRMLATPGHFFVHNLTESNTSNIINFGSYGTTEGRLVPTLHVQRWNNVQGDSRMYYHFGSAVRDTAEARSGACVKVTATSATNPIEIPLGKHRIASVAADIELSVYAKKGATFNGTVNLLAKLGHKPVVDLTEKTMATSYGEHSVVVDVADLENGEWVELLAQVTGTAGEVYFDDFSAAAVT